MTPPLATFEEISADLADLKTFKAEAEAKIKEAKAEADAAKKEAEATKKKLAEVETKKTDENKDNEKVAAKFPKTMKAMKAAAEEKDEKEAAKKMAEAMVHYKSESEEEEKKEKEAAAHRGMGPETLKQQEEIHKAATDLKAELTVLRTEVAKPRIAALSAAYTGKVTTEKLKEYQAAWGQMTIAQLDDQIAQVSVFAGKIQPQIPLGFSTFEQPYIASAETRKDEFMANIDKKTVAELFA